MRNEAPRAVPGLPPSDRRIIHARTEGVLTRRLFAYAIDIIMVFGVMVLLAAGVTVLGVFTLGLGWYLYAIVVPAAAILYSAVTIGGPAQATIGMRLFDLRVIDATTQGRVGGLTAAVHALLFYLAAGTFVLWVVDLIIGVGRGDRRLGHDLVTGVMVTRAS